MEFQIAEAIELIKTLAETENLTQSQALTAFVAEAGLDIEYASLLKAALYEEYTLTEMASDSLTKALYSVFVEGVEEDLSEMDTKETQEGTKYKVRVKDRASGSSYVRYATREKIAELRANPNISSVEITDHGTTGEDDRGQRTAAAKGGRDYDGDGKKESSSKEHAGVVHNAIQRAKGGTPDGQDTRKEEVEVEEGIDFKGAKRIDDARAAERKKKEDKHPILKDKRLAMGKFRPGASDEERREGGREHLKAKDRVPSKKGKKMWEAYLEARAAIAEDKKKISEGLDMWNPDGDAGTHDQNKKLRGKEDAKKKKLSPPPMLAILKKNEKKTQKEEFVHEADIYDAGRENSSQRDKANSGKKIDGKGVDNSTRVKLMPTIGEEIVTESGVTQSQARLIGAKGVNEALRSEIHDMAAALYEEEGEKKYCKLCKKEETRSECSYGGEAWDKNTTSEKKESIELDAAGMPILETKAESRNNARPGPSKEMIDPPADPLGPEGHMNPKGEPKRYKEPGEAPGDRRPNRKKDKSLPNEDGTVPNGSGV